MKPSQPSDPRSGCGKEGVVGGLPVSRGALACPSYPTLGGFWHQATLLEVSATKTGTAEWDLSQPFLLPGTVEQMRTATGLLPGFVADWELQNVPLGCPCCEGASIHRRCRGCKGRHCSPCKPELTPSALCHLSPCSWLAAENLYLSTGLEKAHKPKSYWVKHFLDVLEFPKEWLKHIFFDN